MMDMFFNVKVMNFNGNKVYRYEQSRFSLLLYKFSRQENDDYSTFSSIDDFKRPHIYFLVGFDKSDLVSSIYVGQSGFRTGVLNTFERIKEHKNEEWASCWRIGFVLTMANRDFDETCLNYLENAFYGIIKNSGKYKLWNKIVPLKGHPSESVVADLNEDIKIWNCMFAVAGMYFDNEKIESREKEEIEGLGLSLNKVEVNGTTYNFSFYSLQTRAGADAKICKIENFYERTGKRDPKDYYLLLRGSKLSETCELTDSRSPKYKAAREYIEKYSIQNGILTEDIPMTSLTAIASVVKGYHTSYTEDWKPIVGVLTETQRKWLSDPVHWYIQFEKVNAVVKMDGVRCIILRGSRVSEKTTYSNSKNKQSQNYKTERERLVAEKIIEKGIFTRDYVCSSKAMADGIIMGTKMSATWRRFCEFDYPDIVKENNL